MTTPEGDAIMDTPADIQAITIPTAERAVILDLFGSPESFAQWQAEVLRAEIERRAAAKGQNQAQKLIQQTVDETKSQMPSLFEQ